MYTLYVLESDMEMVKRILEEENVEVTNTRDITDIEMNMWFFGIQTHDTPVKVIQVFTTTRKYNRIVKRTSGKKLY